MRSSLKAALANNTRFGENSHVSCVSPLVLRLADCSKFNQLTSLMFLPVLAANIRAHSRVPLTLLNYFQIYGWQLVSRAKVQVIQRARGRRVSLSIVYCLCQFL